ncbi:MAG: response regulator [Thermodesulfobacteriota bacterium]|nr:response regulator [Thermodesulfobacteriota bacterium]
MVNLLIIETDKIFRLNLALNLRLGKYHIFETGNKIKAKKILTKKSIDVVLLGLNGLKREGLSLLKEIKKIRPFTEIIMINSCDQIPLSIEGMKLGAFDDFLLPFDMNALIGRIQEAYQQKRGNEKTKKSLLQRYQDIMVAVSFAEMGEADTAIKLLENNKKTC